MNDLRFEDGQLIRSAIFEYDDMISEEKTIAKFENDKRATRSLINDSYSTKLYFIRNNDEINDFVENLKDGDFLYTVTRIDDTSNVVGIQRFSENQKTVAKIASAQKFHQICIDLITENRI